jgi:hypothetical protein
MHKSIIQAILETKGLEAIYFTANNIIYNVTLMSNEMTERSVDRKDDRRIFSHIIY